MFFALTLRVLNVKVSFVDFSDQSFETMFTIAYLIDLKLLSNVVVQIKWDENGKHFSIFREFDDCFVHAVERHLANFLELGVIAMEKS